MYSYKNKSNYYQALVNFKELRYSMVIHIYSLEHYENNIGFGLGDK